MKNNSFVRPKKNKNKILLLFFIILITFFLFFLSKELSNTFFKISKPFQSFFYSLEVKFLNLTDYLNKKELLRERDSLLEDNYRLNINIAELEEIRKENQALKKIIDLKINSDFKISMGLIIAKDILNQSILINLGSKDGVEKGMTVITEDKVLVGIIEETFKEFSRIKTINEKDFIFDAKIQRTDVMGLVAGSGRSSNITLIPKESDIKEKDILVTVSFGGVFPEGIFIGSIKNIKESELTSFKEAEIIPFFNIKRTEKVFVILNK
jgi:rod shape-determining protein MreC